MSGICNMYSSGGQRPQYIVQRQGKYAGSPLTYRGNTIYRYIHLTLTTSVFELNRRLRPHKPSQTKALSISLRNNWMLDKNRAFKHVGSCSYIDRMSRATAV